MCGINGLFGDIDYSDIGDFKVQSILTQLRGKHSTGVLGAYADGSFDLIKSLGGVESLVLGNPEFFNKDTWNYRHYYSPAKKGEKSVPIYPDFLLNHGRWATVGEVNKDNAQPFHFKGKRNIVGCHNGTIHDWFASRFWPEFDKGNLSDSYYIFRDISEIEEDEELIEYIGKLRGAYTLIWYDLDEGSMYAVRNDQRPLFVTGTDHTNNTMAFASTEWQLRVTYKEKPISLKADTLVRFYTTPKNKVNYEELGEIKYVQTNIYNTGYNRGYSDWWDNYGDYEDDDFQAPFVRKEGTNVWISRKVWDEAKYMCECCLTKLPSSKSKECTWVSADVVVCDDCKKSGAWAFPDEDDKAFIVG